VEEWKKKPLTNFKTHPPTQFEKQKKPECKHFPLTASKSNRLMLKEFAEHFRALKLLPKKMFVNPSLGTRRKEREA
jgi:hypothetical protein